jgi:tripartite-type tricarboxylate transporter receptor subunit TctC
MTLLWRLIAVVLVITGVFAHDASAQTWPQRPIHIIAPFPAGGLVDVLARSVGAELARSLGQPVIVENKPGAGGNIGADAAAKAEPDGYTLLMTSPGIQSINQFLYKSMPFDPETAFAPISLVADMPMLVVVNPKVGARTLHELIDLARKNPGKLTFGSAGIGTTGHLGQVLLVRTANIDVTHVPYRGASPSIIDLIAGQIDGVVDNPPTVVPHIKGRTIVPLAVAAKERLAVLPDLPTAAEAGLPGWEASSWFGLVAPAGTPNAIISRLAQEIAAAVRQPAIQRFTTESGARMVATTPEEFDRLIRAERTKWGEIIKAAKISAE